MKKRYTILSLLGLAALSYGFLSLGNPGIAGILFFVEGTPATEELIILSDHQGRAQLSIVGMSSQYTHQQPVDISGQAVRQDISQLVPGFYTLRLQYADGTVLYQRFVKM
ncbi:MAG: hypothetical protein AAFY48_03210 [Bacteroidota bacterium]